MAATIFFLLVC